MSINKAVVSGNLTRDPELRSTAGGTDVLRFSVAVNDRVKNGQTGEWEDRANYIGCTVFGRRAEGLSRILAKGSKVAVEGRLRWSEWEDRKTGEKRGKVEVVVDEVELMSRDGGGQEKPAYRKPSETMGSIYDEDIPF